MQGLSCGVLLVHPALSFNIGRKVVHWLQIDITLAPGLPADLLEKSPKTPPYTSENSSLGS
jgi:hypothetical protein